MAVYRFEQLSFSVDDGRLVGPGEGTGQTLRPQAARLLQTLLDRAEEVVPRQDLIDAIWGREAVVDFEAGLAALMRELRQALSAAGASEQLLETVPRRGYRFNATVSTASAGTRPPTPRRPWLWPAGIAGLLLLLVVIGAAYWIRSGPGVPADARLAILPLESYEALDGVPEHAGLLLADTLLTELLSRPVAGLDLIGRTSLRPYIDREDAAAAVARELGVELLFEGTIARADAGSWQVELRLLAVPQGRVLWSQAVTGPAGQPLEPRAVASRLVDGFAAAWPDLRPAVEIHDTRG